MSSTVSQKSLSGLFRNAFGGLPRPVWLLALVMLINRSGTMVIIFMTVYATQKLHFSVEQAGIIMAIFGAGSLVGVIISGKLTDKVGYKKIMFWSLMLGGILFIVLGQLHDYIPICICTFFVSAFGEAFRPANMTAVAYYSTAEGYTRSISLNRLAINLGFSIGPAVGGFLAAHNYELLFWADGFTCIGAALVVKFLLGKRKNTTIAKPDNAAQTSADSPYRDKVYMVFSFLGILYAISFFQMFSTMPLYYKQVHHLSETNIGALMAMNGILVATIEMVMIYKIEGKWSKLNFVSLGAFLLVMNYLILPFAVSIWWLVMSMLLITFSEMFAMPFMNSFMMSRAKAHNRGQYASVYSMTWSVAQITAPIIATQTIAHFGFDTLWIVLACISLTVSIGMKLLEKRSKKIIA